MNKIFTSLKIIVAAVLAIIIAQLLKLEFAVSAGIVAILSVQATKKETISTALARFYAFILALFISYFCYRFLGFNLKAFFLYLTLFIFACQFFKWYSAMAMDSVLISHFISLNAFGLNQIKNELLLFVIGVSAGILANIFLHKKTDEIELLKKEADEQIRMILKRMAQKILDLDFSDYTGKCFTKLDQAILKAQISARNNFNNQFSKKDVFDQKYIEMRQKQKNVLFEIYKCIIELKASPLTALRVSEFFSKVSDEYEKDNDVKNLLDELHLIQMEMKKVKLPESRIEFEDRAVLFMILKRMEEFLAIKNEFHKEYIALSDK
ncbi:aromatic acid exporter family protein [Treponema sp.]|uniref:aromatic acid exporter family protein n=1 Tax=Treponema sp. TaxID=166 RepID=UPI0025FF0D84|nr:aromatic acid exporter family protein [Treponema sp.]MCR5217302.1 hypothetical protein [Treponema sp.]